MTVFVDALFPTTPKTSWPYNQACHMTTDGPIEELHEFAQRLGLRREWFQGHSPNDVMWHYDLTATMRRKALGLGAQEITIQAFSARVQARAWELRRDRGGELVRVLWVKKAQEHPAPKASWLVSWQELGEWDKEVDRSIWEGIAAPYEEKIREMQKELTQLRIETRRLQASE